MAGLNRAALIAGCGVLLSAVVQANPIPVVEAGASGSSNAPAQVAVVSSAQAAARPQADAVTRLLQQLDAMQKELGELRGQMEEQRHQLEQMKQQQKDRYLDLDRRLSALAMQAKSAPPPAPPAAADSAKAPNATQKTIQPAATEQDAYQAAFALIRQREFDQAITALDQFLSQYPQSSLAANALYWQGEVYLAKTEYPQAKQAFERVLKEYPESSKISDATYKLGRTLIQMDDSKAGKNRLEETVKRYPDSSAARLAAEYLKGLD